MKTRELVELAALVASQGELLIEGHGRLSESGLRAYWIASKTRLDRWGLALRNYARDADLHDARRARDQWPRIQPVVEEVLVGEVLTRVWSAVVAGYDLVREQHESAAITRGIYRGHLEARHRVLNLIARRLEDSSPSARAANHLRQRCERWTDLLVGHLLVACDVSEFAFDRERAFDFCDSHAGQRRSGVGATAWQLTLDSLHSAFRYAIHGDTPHGELNARIAAGIVCCLPCDLEDAGISRGLWLARAEHAHADAETMVAELLEETG
jgi:hypothetical protein